MGYPVDVYTFRTPSIQTPGLFPSTIEEGIETGEAGRTVTTCAAAIPQMRKTAPPGKRPICVTTTVVTS
jgi:hypothetical protein